MNAQRGVRGESLVSMMVGVVIAVMTIGAMLTAYRAMVSVSLPATRAAVRDGQATSALLAAQIELQQAGFGIRSVEGGANIVLSHGDQRIVWRFRDSVDATGMRCAGLDLRVDGLDSDGIYYLDPVDCGSADDALAFPATRLLASAAVLFSAEGEVRAWDIATARFRLATNQTCGPFGIAGTAANRTLVVLEDIARDPDALVFSYCLTNT